MKKITLPVIILIIVVLGLLYLNSNRAKNLDNVPQASVSVDAKNQDKSLKQTSPKTSISSTGSDVLSNPDEDLITVSYTSKGFSPFITEITLGQSVKFVNNRSDRALWIVSVHPKGTQEFYPGFSGSRSLSKGESFVLPFTKAGAWSFNNLNDASHQGVILVR